ncbi:MULTISPECIES: peptidylprolyl isomerase [unclassified Sphingomonas]|uniref:peptidylprolyl isomerase n=1 Tax=unclassified Sphingomonas TaxID=196159 RepID=UPI0008302FF5|nr:MULTISPECIES: peptidylprolyl isomerase [unclassified Sphingomonas]
MNIDVWKRGLVRFAMTAALATTGAAALATQDGGDSAAGLNIPEGLQIFGKQDPNIRKPTAIVNRAVITGTDVDHRVNMIVALNQINLSAQERDQLRLQVLRSLIDETLQIQEAAANEITITPTEIAQGFARISRNFGRSPDQMREYLRSVGSSERSMVRQIEGELAWNRLLGRQVQPFVNVGEEEVKSVLERLEASKGSEEFHLKEVYLSATPERADEVYAAVQQMLEQMRGGAPFEYFARTYSEASTKAVNGDLGWVRPGMLPSQLSDAAQRMQIGQVAGPIEVPGGFSLLYLVDKRKVLTADPRDARLSLRQMTIRFPAGTTQAQATDRAAAFAQATQQIRGCGNVGAVAQDLGAEVVDNDSVRVRDLPPALQEIMLQLQVGQATPPFGTPDEGVRVLVLCGRDDPRSAGLPSMEQMQASMEQERVNLVAQRKLRDLRRDAIVEYR